MSNDFKNYLSTLSNSEVKNIIKKNYLKQDKQVVWKNTSGIRDSRIETEDVRIKASKIVERYYDLNRVPVCIYSLSKDISIANNHFLFCNLVLKICKLKLNRKEFNFIVKELKKEIKYKNNSIHTMIDIFEEIEERNKERCIDFLDYINKIYSYKFLDEKLNKKETIIKKKVNKI